MPMELPAHDGPTRLVRDSRKHSPERIENPTVVEGNRIQRSDGARSRKVVQNPLLAMAHCLTIEDFDENLLIRK
jgi:hypothetical protein